MRTPLSSLLLVVCLCLLVSCNSVSPETYFSTAVLNTNMFHGFASDGLQRELESPSVKLVEGTRDQTTAMKRKEVINTKIEYLEKSLEKIKGLRKTDDAKDMVQASVDLYEYALPVYKNEYTQLAKLYDDGAPKEQIALFSEAVSTKYYPKFEELHKKLTDQGKLYAAKHNINVNWDVRTSPRN